MSDLSLVPEEVTEVIFTADVEESSEEPPMEEWSSLIIKMPEENKKKLQFSEGLYHPGSGEVCAKYITLSDSDVLRHPYYNYPAVIDPGIEKALFSPEDKIVYADDGQELYLAICDETNEASIKLVVKGLLNEVIDLRYYCVTSKGARAISLALRFNKSVKVLNLSDNFLGLDAVYHLADMLSSNSSLVELNLSGCKIGHAGVRRLFNGLTANRCLKILNLDKNEVSDQGMELIAAAVFRGIDLHEISLSYNKITGKGVNYLAEVFETHNHFTKINLSWNNLYSPLGTCSFLSALKENKVLNELNLSWNSMANPRLGLAIQKLLSAPNLRHLNLSNNKFNGEAITNILPGLNKAKKLITLDLSYNPMTPEDATNVLIKLKSGKIKVNQVLMENVFVDQKFLSILHALHETPSLKYKKSFSITYGGVIGGFKGVGPDMREVVLNRAEFIAKKPKKRPVDIALVAMKLLKDGNEIMPTKEFCMAMLSSGASFDNDLLEEIAAVFAGPRLTKTKTVDIKLLVDYMKRKWPERKLPPTPPPEPEPEPAPVIVKATKGKGKKK